MIIEPGTKVHIIHRQFYEGDARRHFVGSVEKCEGALALVKGYIFAIDTKLNQFTKRDALRTRVIPLDSGDVIVNVLPADVHIEKITYKYRPGGDTLVSDGSDWHLDLTHL